MNETQSTINGLSLHIASTDNDQPPLLMLHGVTRRWSTFLPLIPALSLQWQVHATDFRGHGRSDRASDYRVLDYVSDIVRLIQHRFSVPLVLYGHSLGAMVAAAAAAELQDRVRAVILEDPPMHTMGQRIAQNTLHSFFSGLAQYAGDNRPAADIARDLASVQLHDVQHNSRIRLGDIRDAVQLRFTAASLKDVDPRVFTSILAGEWLQGYDMERIFETLRMPVLLLQADIHAGGMLTDIDAALLRRHTPDLTHIKLDQTGHVIHVAATSQLINMVSAFLQSLSN